MKRLLIRAHHPFSITLRPLCLSNASPCLTEIKKERKKWRAGDCNLIYPKPSLTWKILLVSSKFLLSIQIELLIVQILLLSSHNHGYFWRGDSTNFLRQKWTKSYSFHKLSTRHESRQKLQILEYANEQLYLHKTFYIRPIFCYSFCKWTKTL